MFPGSTSKYGHKGQEEKEEDEEEDEDAEEEDATKKTKTTKKNKKTKKTTTTTKKKKKKKKKKKEEEEEDIMNMFGQDRSFRCPHKLLMNGLEFGLYRLAFDMFFLCTRSLSRLKGSGGLDPMGWGYVTSIPPH